MFNIRQEDREGRYRLVLQGELGLPGAEELEAAITRLCTAGALEIELDLRELTFMDSQGLRAILAAREALAGEAVRGDGPARRLALAGAWRRTERTLRPSAVAGSSHGPGRSLIPP